MLFEPQVLARPIIEAVLNGVWQGILLFAVVAACMRLASRTNAATRYVLWWVGLAGVLALPVASWLWGQAASGAWLLPAVAFDASGPGSPVLLLPDGPWPEALVLGWAAVAAVLLGRVARGYLAMQALKARSEPLSRAEWEVFRGLLDRHPAARPIRIRRSRDLPSPITAGLSNPMILMPADLLGRLRAEDLRQIVLHELTHVRRGDDRAILLQRVVEALFFFHPAVHWICARLDLEREIACDDRVVALTGERKAYARCLTHLAELGPMRPAPLASGALLHRGHLVQRVTLLLDARRRVGERVSAALTLGALGVAGAAVVGAAGLSPVIGVPDRQVQDPLADMWEEPPAPVLAEAVEEGEAREREGRRASSGSPDTELATAPPGERRLVDAEDPIFGGYPDAKARALAEDAARAADAYARSLAAAPAHRRPNRAEIAPAPEPAVALEEEDEDEEDAFSDDVATPLSAAGRPADGALGEGLAAPAVRDGPAPSPRGPEAVSPDPADPRRSLGDAPPPPPAGGPLQVQPAPPPGEGGDAEPAPEAPRRRPEQRPRG